MDAATEAAERILEITGAALAAADFGAFARCFRLPYTLGTEDGGRSILSRNELNAMFERAVARYAEMGVTAIRRRVAAAQFDDAGQIRTSHVSQLFRGTEAITPPFPSYAVLSPADEGWQVGHSQYWLTSLAGHARLLIGKGETGAETLRATGPVALCVQRTLQDITRTMLEDDFAALCARVRFPLFIHGSEAVQVIADEAALRQEHDRRMTDFRVLGVTDVVRLVKTADLLAEDRLHATYRTHVLSGSALVVPSYTSAVTLERGPDALWRVACVIHSKPPAERPGQRGIPGGAA
jgi:hypothetical protein